MKPAFKHNNIPVVCSSDNKYVPYLLTLISSIISNISDTYNYDIIILEDMISEVNKNIIIKNERRNVSIRFFDMSVYLQMNKMVLKKPEQGKWSETIYFRLFIPYILNEYKKVIYLDSDIINLCDIAQLYNVDIQDVLMGATRLCGRVVAENSNMFTQSYTYHHFYLSEIDGDDYFNSGVLLINIEKFKNKYSESYIFRLANEQNYKMPDQDLLNILCKKNVKFIESGWNWQPYTEKEFSNILKLLPKGKREYFINGYSNKKNIHYTIPVKPWEEPYGVYSSINDYFLQYAINTALWNDILNKINEYQKYKIESIILAKRTWTELKECAIYNKVYLYGYGNRGKEFIRLHEEITLSAIIDRDAGEKDIRCCFPLIKLDVLDDKNVGIVVSNDQYYDIIKLLRNKGFCNLFSYKCLEKRERYAWNLEIEDLKKARLAMNLLSDNRSKEIYWNIVNKREQILYDRNVKYVDIYDGNTYFRDDFYNITDHEVYVDIGGENLVSVEKFKQYVNGKYAQIYALSEDNFEEIKRMCDSVNHKFTFIKINTCSTMKILKELKWIIKETKPKLAVCISNSYADLWEVPIYIKQTFKDYKLFIRHHSPTSYLTVMYASC